MQDFFVCNRAWVESEQSSHRISCILQEFGEIFGLDTKFAQFDRMYFTFFLQCNQCINEIGRTVAQAILARAFKFFPSATATGRYL